jgi:hypothetical protein
MKGGNEVYMQTPNTSPTFLPMIVPGAICGEILELKVGFLKSGLTLERIVRKRFRKYQI